MVFGVGKVQMKFLHLLSMEASHGITVHCLTEPLRSAAVSSASRPLPPVRRPLRFRGWNGQIFEKDTLLEPRVLQDGCKVKERTVKRMRTFLLY